MEKINNNHDIFISYRNNGGLAYARIVQLALEVRGYSNVFFSYDSLEKGQFDQQLISAVQNCKDFILILTEGALDNCANKDDNVTKEILAALNSKCNIIPVTINQPDWKWPVNFPDDLMPLRNIQYTSLYIGKYFKEGIDKIINRIDSKPSEGSESKGGNGFIDICLNEIPKKEIKFKQVFRDFEFDVEIMTLSKFILIDYSRCENNQHALSEELNRITALSEEDFFKETNYVPTETRKYSLGGLTVRVQCWGYPFFVLSVDNTHVAMVKSPENTDRAKTFTAEFFSNVKEFRLTKEKVCEHLERMIKDPFSCSDVMSIPARSHEDELNRMASYLEKRIKEASDRVRFIPSSNPKFSCYPNRIYYIGYHDMDGISLLNIREASSENAIDDERDGIIASYVEAKEVFVDGWEIEPLQHKSYIPEVHYGNFYSPWNKSKNRHSLVPNTIPDGMEMDPAAFIESVFSAVRMSDLKQFEKGTYLIGAEEKRILLASAPICVYADHVLQILSTDNDIIRWALVATDWNTGKVLKEICRGQTDQKSGESQPIKA